MTYRFDERKARASIAPFMQGAEDLTNVVKLLESMGELAVMAFEAAMEGSPLTEVVPFMVDDELFSK